MFLEFTTAIAMLATAPHPAQPVVDAERAFAAKVKAEGMKRGFLAFAAPGAFMFTPQPTPVTEAFAGAPETVETPPLEWWPQFAGMAASADFGFTTGPATSPVRYFTVWRRQADGSWKYIYDGGSPTGGPMPPQGDKPVVFLAQSGAGAGSAAQALEELAPIEAELARDAAGDAKTAFLRHLADDGIVGGSGQPAYNGRAEQEAELARRPAALQLRPLGGEASGAGDMAFTYGEARWTREDKVRWGHYVRIWQKRSEGWRLAIDFLIPAPGTPPL